MRGGRVPYGRRAALSFGLAALVATLLLSGAANALSVGSVVATDPPSAGAPLPALPFAERAGYDPTLGSEVTDPTVALGTLSVVVSFEPSTPTFYDVPAPGAPALTPAEIANEYGLSPAAYAAAEAYFEARGLTVEHVWPDRLSLTVEGSAAAIGAAFGTTIFSGSYEGRTVTYPASPPALPADLAPEVAAVVGLTNGLTTFSLPLSPAGSAGPDQGTSDLVTPAIARQIYGVSDLYNYTGSAKYATGKTIVLLLWGDGYAPSDLATFYSTYYPSSFPAVTITPYPVDGAPAPAASAVDDPSDAPQELTLDLEWSGSMAPGANLDAVYAPDGPASDQYSPSVSSMTDAFNEALGLSGVDAISMSFGTQEGSGGGLESAWTNDISEAYQEHITLLAATGDTGGDVSASPCSGGPAPEYPAADPYVLAVGGTDPTLQTNALGQVTGIASESAWSDSGGGYSTVFSAPSWQLVGSAKAPISAAGHRGMPDVAAAATNDFVYYNGGERAGEGTSFATPLWAGMLVEMDAQLGTSLGFVDGNLYAVGAAEPGGSLPTGLVDITSGGNCLGAAGPGWDTATGWGSPRAVALFADLTASIVNLTLSESPVPAGPGQTVTLTAQVTNESSGAPLVGVPVNLSLTADTSIGPCEGLFGYGTSPSNASGYVVVSVPVPGCYLGSRAVATALVTSDGHYGMAQSVLAVNLLGYLAFLGPLASPPNDVALYVLIMGAAIAAGILLGRRKPSSPRRTGPVAASGAESAPSPTPPPGATGESSGPTVPPAPTGPDPGPPPTGSEPGDEPPPTW
jgi:subtilase family serine protease